MAVSGRGLDSLQSPFIQSSPILYFYSQKCMIVPQQSTYKYRLTYKPTYKPTYKSIATWTASLELDCKTAL